MTLNGCSAIDPSPALECQVCFDTWRHPVQLQPCGHIFCSKCLTASSTKCPTCKSGIEKKTEPTMEIVLAALEVRVQCGSCGWKGTRKASEHHRCGIKDTHTELERHLERSDEEVLRELQATLHAQEGNARQGEEGEGGGRRCGVQRKCGRGEGFLPPPESSTSDVLEGVVLRAVEPL